jgi:hypothetical protein
MIGEGEHLPENVISDERQNKTQLVFYVMRTLRNFCSVVMHVMTVHVPMTFVLGVTQKSPSHTQQLTPLHSYSRMRIAGVCSGVGA